MNYEFPLCCFYFYVDKNFTTIISRKELHSKTKANGSHYFYFLISVQLHARYDFRKII